MFMPVKAFKNPAVSVCLDYDLKRGVKNKSYSRYKVKNYNSRRHDKHRKIGWERRHKAGIVDHHKSFDMDLDGGLRRKALRFPLLGPTRQETTLFFELQEKKGYVLGIIV